MIQNKYLNTKYLRREMNRAKSDIYYDGGTKEVGE